MNLLISVLLALKVYVDPTWSEEMIKEKDPIHYEQAKSIIEKNLYKVEPNGIVIIDETEGKQ
jgi:hypothetical protein